MALTVLPLDLAHRPDDLLAVGEQPVPLQGVVVGEEHVPERLRHGGRVEQLVLHDVDALQEPGDRAEQPTLGIEPPQVEPAGLAGEKCSEAMVVEHVEGLVPGDEVLQQPEAIGVDGPDEEPAELVENGATHSTLGPFGDAMAQLGGGALGEGEGDDADRGHAVGEQVGDALGDDLGLARPGGGDDLQVSIAAVT